MADKRLSDASLPPPFKQSLNRDLTHIPFAVQHLDHNSSIAVIETLTGDPSAEVVTVVCRIHLLHLQILRGGTKPSRRQSATGQQKRPSNMLGLRQGSQSWGNSQAVVTTKILRFPLNSTLNKRVSQQQAR
jgi:hypothetical protein